MTGLSRRSVVAGLVTGAGASVIPLDTPVRFLAAAPEPGFSTIGAGYDALYVDFLRHTQASIYRAHGLAVARQDRREELPPL